MDATHAHLAVFQNQLLGLQHWQLHALCVLETNMGRSQAPRVVPVLLILTVTQDLLYAYQLLLNAQLGEIHLLMLHLVAFLGMQVARKVLTSAGLTFLAFSPCISTVVLLVDFKLGIIELQLAILQVLMFHYLKALKTLLPHGLYIAQSIYINLLPHGLYIAQSIYIN